MQMEFGVQMEFFWCGNGAFLLCTPIFIFPFNFGISVLEARFWLLAMIGRGVVDHPYLLEPPKPFLNMVGNKCVIGVDDAHQLILLHTTLVCLQPKPKLRYLAHAKQNFYNYSLMRNFKT